VPSVIDVWYENSVVLRVDLWYKQGLQSIDSSIHIVEACYKYKYANNKIINLTKLTEVEREDMFVHRRGRGRAGLSAWTFLFWWQAWQTYRPVGHRHSVEEKIYGQKLASALVTRWFFRGLEGGGCWVEWDWIRSSVLIYTRKFVRLCNYYWTTMRLQNDTPLANVIFDVNRVRTISKFFSNFFSRYIILSFQPSGLFRNIHYLHIDKPESQRIY
jgi:hypothetical protein